MGHRYLSSNAILPLPVRVFVNIYRGSPVCGHGSGREEAVRNWSWSLTRLALMSEH